MSITLDITTSSVIGKEQSRTVKFSNATFTAEEAGFVVALTKSINDFVGGYGKKSEE